MVTIGVFNVLYDTSWLAIGVRAELEAVLEVESKSLVKIVRARKVWIAVEPIDARVLYVYLMFESFHFRFGLEDLLGHFAGSYVSSESVSVLKRLQTGRIAYTLVSHSRLKPNVLCLKFEPKDKE
jgi:hypothetical protein